MTRHPDVPALVRRDKEGLVIAMLGAVIAVGPQRRPVGRVGEGDEVIICSRLPGVTGHDDTAIGSDGERMASVLRIIGLPAILPQPFLRADQRGVASVQRPRHDRGDHGVGTHEFSGRDGKDAVADGGERSGLSERH